MRVECARITDFLENIRASGNCSVLDGVVYVDVTERPYEGDKFNSAKFQVTIQASAVITVGEDGQYLLVAGEYCGMDYHDSSQEFKGSDKASALRKRIWDFCNENGLTIRPGIVSE